MKTSPRSRQGFTLIELLTVIAIIGILAAIIIPTVGKVRETAKNARCLSNLRQIGAAALVYASDNKQIALASRPNKADHPSMASGNTGDWFILLQPYLQKRDFQQDTVFRCPSDNRKPDGTGVAVSYGINQNVHVKIATTAARSGFPLNKLREPSRTVMFADSGNDINHVFQIGTTTKNETNLSTALEFYGFLHGASNYNNGAANSFADKQSKGGSCNMVFYDGHTKAFKITDVTIDMLVPNL